MTTLKCPHAQYAIPRSAALLCDVWLTSGEPAVMHCDVEPEVLLLTGKFLKHRAKFRNRGDKWDAKFIPACERIIERLATVARELGIKPLGCLTSKALKIISDWQQMHPELSPLCGRGAWCDGETSKNLQKQLLNPNRLTREQYFGGADIIDIFA